MARTKENARNNNNNDRTVSGVVKALSKKKKKNFSSYSFYIYKVLKQVHPEIGISSRAMVIINDMVCDIFERLANEAANISKISGKNTLLTRDVETAVRLLIPGELQRHAIAEAENSLIKYEQNKP